MQSKPEHEPQTDSSESSLYSRNVERNTHFFLNNGISATIDSRNPHFLFQSNLELIAHKPTSQHRSFYSLTSCIWMQDPTRAPTITHLLIGPTRQSTFISHRTLLQYYPHRNSTGYPSCSTPMQRNPIQMLADRDDYASAEHNETWR